MLMKLVIDTSIVMAVLLNEESREKIIENTREAELIAPHSIYWELGNALSVNIKRNGITEPQALSAIVQFQKMSIRYVDIDIYHAMELSNRYKIYAYDAYLLECSISNSSKLLSLDKKMCELANLAGITVIEV
jgi:predicted nucleic acid-binding protein